ncbi:DUF1854 domain-containing protein [Burkholderiaceae bacterium DAT-1]|nr:DUF1854 domain-containing protein [Burkholderiaceae bacterium DAT-1]
MSGITFTLSRNAFGKLCFTGEDGQITEGVHPVRAFPIAAPDEGVSIVAPDGHELAWIDRLTDAPASVQTLVREELAQREFMPELEHLYEVSTFATPSIWRIRTNRGDTTLVLNGEEDIHRVRGGTLIIVDHHGIQFLIRDLFSLDQHSKRLLDRFL